MPVSPPTTGSVADRIDPWKEDGNIVLAAEGKYFRVHRSILSAHSEVFKDMFESCIDSNGAEKDYIELCPIVHLHDAANDVQIMLKALYDRRQVTRRCCLDAHNKPRDSRGQLPPAVLCGDAHFRRGCIFALGRQVRHADARQRGQNTTVLRL